MFSSVKSGAGSGSGTGSGSGVGSGIGSGSGVGSTGATTSGSSGVSSGVEPQDAKSIQRIHKIESQKYLFFIFPPKYNFYTVKNYFPRYTLHEFYATFNF